MHDTGLDRDFRARLRRCGMTASSYCLGHDARRRRDWNSSKDRNRLFSLHDTRKIGTGSTARGTWRPCIFCGTRGSCWPMKPIGASTMPSI